MKKKIIITEKSKKVVTTADDSARGAVQTHAEKKNPAVLRPVVSAALHDLRAPAGAHKPKKLLGRGSSSGHGKTSTRGSKGQTSRAGRHFYLGFEGGQSPLIRRFPKRGFTTTRFRKVYQLVSLGDLGRIKVSTITPAVLEEKGIIKDRSKPVKVLGNGELQSPVVVQAHAFSQKASAEIINAGGKAEIIHD